jgi:probable HAF family extracellular repeat protein
MTNTPGTLVRLASAFALVVVGVACTDTTPVAPTNALRSTAINTAVSPTDGATVMDLGTLPGFTDHVASAINDAGWVAGVASGSAGNRAFLWKPGAGMTDLGAATGYTRSQAWGINSAGDVVGFSSKIDDQTPRATLWRSGNIIDLGVLAPSSPINLASTAYGINDAGVAVGFSETGQSGPDVLLRTAIRWTQASGMVALPVPVGTRIAEARAINNAGQIVGYVQPVNGFARAAMWSGNSFIDLGALPNGNESDAYSINEVGAVVGWSASSVPWHHAFVWHQGQEMADLGTLPGSIPQGPTSEALGINDAGDIVGFSWATTTFRPAVLWRNGVLAPLPPLASGIEFGTARAINNGTPVKIAGSVQSLPAPARAVVWTLVSNRPPVANAGGPYQGRKKKEAIDFDGRGSSDPDGDPLTFSWNFGDGTPIGSGATPSHVYEKMGTYTVTLTVSDGHGGSATATTQVEILPPGKLDR